jgi:hypothetical protein
MRTMRSMFVAVLALGAGAAMMVFDEGSLGRGAFEFTSAEARVGRPATAVSYAGVARRTTRRAVAVGTAAAAATTTCVQTVDAYGRVITRCR